MSNRLAHESSPYLLQHKDNPVDWYPWGSEALDRAKQEDRPILLSVGYAACHWCHVMERESFENPTIAELMNRWFVNIKVDREERPDIDSIYMTALQALAGHGGWPMTVFATPEGKPFFAGTYYPPEDRPGHAGFPRVLASVAEAWEHRRSDLEDQAAHLTAAVGKAVSPDLARVEPSALEKAYRIHLENLDSVYGGFGGAPKFPQPPNLEFLLRVGSREWAPEAWNALTLTLGKMADGGIYDHLGGGFARYAVDRIWLVPHFEKMLYDNANLSRLYLRAGQVADRDDFLHVAQETLDYILDDLGLPDGGFATSEDADSEGEEGKFYVFSASEFANIVGDHADLLAGYFGVTPEGNFEGNNILHRAIAVEDLATSAGLSTAVIGSVIAEAKQALLETRNRRVRPGLDDKVVVAWNGLAIRALAEAGAVLDRPDYLAAAERNARFILDQCRRADGRLYRTWRQGTPGPLAVLEDYGGYALGLLTLYQATGDTTWYQEAESLIDEMLHLFRDDAGFYATGSDAEELITRPTDVMDNPSASGNSLAAEALHISYLLSGRSDRLVAQDSLFRAGAELMNRHPTAVGHLLAVQHTVEADNLEVAITGSPTKPLSDVVWKKFRPNVVLALRITSEDERIVPLLAGKGQTGEGALAYVCRQFACQAPVSDPKSLAAQLD
ncbi:MAG: thioredoxin domain-containing protein [Acidimicrobiia bacterium]|nr:thioredoxin domain-containing protein [Acidimicrobiia bacterium]